MGKGRFIGRYIKGRDRFVGSYAGFRQTETTILSLQIPTCLLGTKG